VYSFENGNPLIRYFTHDFAFPNFGFYNITIENGRQIEISALTQRFLHSMKAEFALRRALSD